MEVNISLPPDEELQAVVLTPEEMATFPSVTLSVSLNIAMSDALLTPL